LKAYLLTSGQLEPLDGGDATLIDLEAGEAEALEGLIVVRSGTRLFPAWMVPTNNQPTHWPKNNWSVRLATTRTVPDLYLAARELNAAQASLLFRSLPDRVLHAWTGAAWGTEQAAALYRQVLGRYGDRLDAVQTVTVEVPVLPHRTQDALELPMLTLVEDPGGGSVAPGAKPGRSVPLAALPLSAEVATALGPNVQARGLYLHQALALNYLQSARREEHDLVLSTPTASGKTLSFLPGILEDLLQRGGGALFVYPLKALAQDQYETIKEIQQRLPEGRVLLKRYFGNDAFETGEQLPNLLIATPDKLNHHLVRPEVLAFLATVKYIVLDEAHTYRGSFGTHMSLFLRRLLAMTRGRPTLILSSATLRNTAVFARRLTGRPRFRVVGAASAPVYPRHLYLTAPPKQGKKVQRFHEPGLRSLAQSARERRAKGLVFIGGRDGTRRIAKTLVQKGDSEVRPVAFPFYSNMPGYDQRLLELRTQQGPMIAVSTSTLEAGIDIGELDMVGIVGFPRSRNSFKQMAGRAGRGGTAHVAFFPGTGPADEYYSQGENLRRLLHSESEPVHLNPHNPMLVAPHIARLRYELSVAHQETGPAVLGRLYPEGLPDDVRERLLPAFDDPVRQVSAPALRGESGLPHLVVCTGSDSPDRSLKLLRTQGDPDWLLDRLTLENAYREWALDSLVRRNDRSFRVLDWVLGEQQDGTWTSKAVIIWVQDVTDRVVSPEEAVLAERGLLTLPDGAILPHTNQASLTTQVGLAVVTAEANYANISARAGRGQVMTSVKAVRERQDLRARAVCPNAQVQPPRLSRAPSGPFQVRVRQPDGSATGLAQYGPEDWALWRSGHIPVISAQATTKQYHVVEEFHQSGDGSPVLIVRLHSHDREVSGACVCGAQTEQAPLWESSQEAAPDEWATHPVFNLSPKVFETDVAELILGGASLPALHALTQALVKALPDVLEVDPQEVGAEAVSEGGVTRLLLWDTTPGGTGISASVIDALEGLLLGARDLLRQSEYCSCGGTGCYGCFIPLSKLFWTQHPAPPEADAEELVLRQSAPDAALRMVEAFVEQARSALPTEPVSESGPSPSPALPANLPFTHVLLGLDGVLLEADGTACRSMDRVLDQLLASRLEVGVVSNRPRLEAAALLEQAFPAHASRLVAQLTADARTPGTEGVRSLMPNARIDRLLWLTSSPDDVTAALTSGATAALACWHAEPGARETGPDLLLNAPCDLLAALARPHLHAWPLEQVGKSDRLSERLPTVLRELRGERLEVHIFGRYAPARLAARHNRLRMASQQALSFKDNGTQADEIAGLITQQFPQHVIAFVPSSRNGGLLGPGLALLSKRLAAAGLSTLALTWLQAPRRQQKQAGSVEGRLMNVTGCLAVPDLGPFSGRPVLIVDDIVTSGATLLEARRVLGQAGAEVQCLAVAQTLTAGRDRT